MTNRRAYSPDNYPTRCLHCYAMLSLGRTGLICTACNAPIIPVPNSDRRHIQSPRIRLLPKRSQHNPRNPNPNPPHRAA